MVVFTCNHCGESVHKPKVEKHYETKCRNNYPDLCCIDCLKDFRGPDHKGHTKCVTEAERYGGKGFVAKASANKGEKKQNAWIEIVQSVLDENKNLSGSLRQLLEKVSIQPNTPRKESKFINFVRSMDYRANQNDISSAWSLLSEKLSLIKVNLQQTNGKPEVQINGSENNNKKDADESKNSIELETVENKDDTKKSKKHKKSKVITDETTKAEPDESTPVENNNDEPKKKSKKNKKSNIVDNQENTETALDENNIEVLTKKSKKKKDTESSNDNVIENGTIKVETNVENNSNDNSDTKKSKKAKKNKLENLVNNDESITNGDNTTADEKSSKSKKRKLPVEDTIANDDTKTELNTENNGVEEKPLSKKERKEKKKREKYEAELKKISKETKEPEPEMNGTSESVSEAKKSKKRKLANDENIDKPIESNTNGVVEDGQEEPSAKKIKVNDPEAFDWKSAISSVLTGKNKEISLKKLEKKVMNEYCGTFNLSSITDRITKKFMKSLKNIDNVQINNDKVTVCV